ncbi:MAG: M20/M25/M40 family metallo-hydrolase [Symbiobacteriia bacterium]
MTQRVVELLLELVTTDSASFQERVMADLLTTKLRGLGFEVYEDLAGQAVGSTSGNLLARLPGLGSKAGQEPLLFSAHMDRVAGGIGIKPVTRDDVIYSDGTTILGADDAAGLAAILEGVQVATETGMDRPPIEVIFSICEENGLLGSQNLDYSWLTARQGFVMDSGGPVGTVILQGPYQSKVTAVVHGRAAHAGVAPEKGINAIRIAADAIARMRIGRIDPQSTANIGSIAGGVATNIVPDRVDVKGEARSLDGSTLRLQVQHMVSCFEQAAADAGGQAEVEVKEMYPGFHLPESAPVVQRAVKAIRQLGREPVLRATGGGSDANVLNGHGLPTVGLGLGYEEVHSFGEHIPVAQLVLAAQLVTQLILGQ